MAPARCADRIPERRALFGDLHVHTSLSSDAYVFGTRTRPDDAYRFASGAGAAEMSVVTQGGLVQSMARIPRPLDFAAITDHAEMIAGPAVCTTPGNVGYDSEVCRQFRAPWKPFDTLDEGVAIIVALLDALNSETVCGEGGVRGKRCLEGMATAWQEIQDSAARFDAPCDFTTFVAYEYSSNPEMSKVHRNVIFRNAQVPALPVSSRIVPHEIGLWKSLAAECSHAGTGCDALTIPHNPNLSNGRAFALDYGGASSIEEQREIARLRDSFESLVEIFQIKGDSECRNELEGILGGPDELCDFEKYRAPFRGPIEDCGEGVGGGALLGRGCFTRRDFARYAIARGLAEEERIGVNPFKVGFIGSTDIHEGLPGDTEDWVRDGIQRPQRTNSFGADNPGGLAAVWAEENTRESIFEALRRRETFATSGPRMRLRLFGGWDLPEDLCEMPDLAARGYASGVAMGSDLPRRPDASTDRRAPTFVTSALADPGSPGHPGGLLQRLQIVKMTSDAAGHAVQRVIDVAGGATDAYVEAATCEPRGSGAASLCAIWSDPDFDPAERAAYYARIIENPSCRSYTRACLNLEGADRPAACDDESIRRYAQERAWSSPIWYAP
ncbi:MAG: DUF3604 domain-containing protein [bacterium]|nr:DUF3604 domain-containing protein [bacterium]